MYRKLSTYKSIFSTLAIFVISVFSAPTAHAQFGTPPDPTASIGSFFDFLTWMISAVFVPFLFVVASILIIYGIVIQVVYSSNEEQKRKGVKYMLWGIIGFAVMSAVWGLVAILTGTFFGTSGIGIPTLPEG